MRTRARLVLASRSHARVKMLEQAGLVFSAHPADIDESAITRNLRAGGDDAAAIAHHLALEKARAVSARHEGAYVIGSDQILEHRGELLDKAGDRHEAMEKLRALRGDAHQLIASVCVVRDGVLLWSHEESATMVMKNISDEDIEHYAARAGAALTENVGAYALEGVGAWLFEKVEGDFFTILGMPLLPLLSFLKERGYGL